MTWREQGEESPSRHGRPGGDWQGVRPTLDNPMSWSVLLFRAVRIDVRIHVVFLIYVAIRLARSLVAPHDAETVPLSFPLVALMLGCLFVVVLAHEFGHCLACRRTGGDADEILMWPLGGLAFCRPPHRWSAHLVTAAGGPMVNVAIFLVLAPVLGAITGRWIGGAIPNPFGPLPFGGLEREPWWLLTLLALHDVSFVILLFNLLPVFPLDGARICQACLWPRVGYVRSMRLTVYAGYFGAIALGIFGAVAQEWMLVAIAVFGGVTCYVTLRQLQWTESALGGDDDLYAQSLWGSGDGDEATEAPRDRRAARRAETEEARAGELDRILAKIAESGMAALTRRERRLLREVTARRREEKDG